MVFGLFAICFRCAFLRGIECFLLRKKVSSFVEATREKRFTTMSPLSMSRDVTCHRLWRHDCVSNSIQFELIYFISIWTSQNLLKIRTLLSIRQRNELFDRMWTQPHYRNRVFIQWNVDANPLKWNGYTRGWGGGILPYNDSTGMCRAKAPHFSASAAPKE